MDKKIAQDLYASLLRIRRAEEEIAKRYADQEMRCPVHLSIGQEGPAVALAASLNHEDYVMGSHRSHAHYLAKGGTVLGLVAELYGRTLGCARGHGGSMHLIDLSKNFLGSTSIVASTIPVAVGAAFSAKLKGENRITAACFGDGAVEEGVFHEAMNFAALHHLRVLFFCENNFYSIFTPLNKRQPNRPLTDLAKAHGVEAHALDGSDVYGITQKLKFITDDMRESPRPVFIEVATYRYREHCGHNTDEHIQFRPDGELDLWKGKDPLAMAKKDMRDAGLWSDQWAADLEKTLAAEISEAFELAISAPFPPASELGALTYAK